MATPLVPESKSGEYGPIVFITHAHEDRARATAVKAVLRLLGLTGFVAHEDIEGGLEWEEEILRNLSACVGVVVLLTEEARRSSWVNQEIGIAVGTNRPVRSIGRAVAPWGLLYRWQSAPWKSQASDRQGDVREARETNLVELYGLLDKAGVASRRRLITGLGHTIEFDEARASVLLLASLGELDPDEAIQLVQVATHNADVLGCYKAKELLPKMLAPWKEIIDPGDIDTLDASGINV